MLFELKLANLLLDPEDSLDHGGCHFAECKRVIILGQHAWLARHALEVRPEDHKAVVLEDDQVQPGLRVALEQALPDAHPDHADLHREHDHVSQEGTDDPCAFDNKPHLFS